MSPLLFALALASPDVHGLLATDGRALVLTHTDVHASVVADLAFVDVVQTFHNPYDTAIDATYVFPLPEDAAVRDLTVTCGERVIRSDLLTAEEARKRYDAARQDGRRAALLEQQRANLFTQHVAGLCPGETVQVALQYVDAIEVDAGVHSFVFPTTMGHRYDPGELEEAPLVQSLARTLSVRVEVDAGVPLQSIWSDTMSIAVVGEDARGAEIELLDGRPDADVHIGWTQAAEGTQASVATARDGAGDRYVALSLTPPRPDAIDPDGVRDRELVFVLDASCSMRGAPWEAAAETVTTALDGMRPGDAFNVVRFSSAASAAFPRPVPATPENVVAARAWLGRFEGGGTEMSAGIIEALDQPGDPEALRMVLLLTDGYIGSEEDLFRTARQHLGDNDRIFALGIGASVNRFLLDGLAHHGRGMSDVQLPGTPVAESVARFVRRIDAPLLTDITVDWGDLGVDAPDAVHPPDLFVGQPLHVVAQVDGADYGIVTVRGRLGGEPYQAQVAIDLEEALEDEAVPTLWARRTIQGIARDLELPEAVREARITPVALRHRLVSTYTSLVAVDSSPGGCRAEGEVDVPSLRPAGTEGIGEASGFGGLGTKGVGIGGGGLLGSLSGGVGGLGRGAGGYGTGGGTFGSKGSGGTSVAGRPIVMGSLDKSTVEGVIKRHLNPIRYCYQRELTKDPTLQGKLVVKFGIGADGTVRSASIASDTLGNDALGGCVVGRVMRMTFAAPGGGGTVEVSYPFVFSP